MKILTDYSVRVFGTGMNCIDTVDGECARGLTVDECIKKCEDSPYCNAGYHVGFDDLPLETFCVPLNTIFYQNTNFLDNVIDVNNTTRLSRDNGMNMTIFYNEKRFPDDVNLLDKPYLFYSNNCYLYQDRGPQGRFYLHSDFCLYPIRETATTVVLAQTGTLLIDFDLRLTRDSGVTFLKSTELSALIFDPKAQRFVWMPYTTFAGGFTFRDHPGGFINEKETFYLVRESDEKYLAVSDDGSNRLTVSKEKPEWPFALELNTANLNNAFARTNWKETPQKFPKEWKNLNDPVFLCENFKNCRVRTASPFPTKQRAATVTVLLSLTAVVCVAIACCWLARGVRARH